MDGTVQAAQGRQQGGLTPWWSHPPPAPGGQLLVNALVQRWDQQRKTPPGECTAITSASEQTRAGIRYGWGRTPKKEHFAGSQNRDIPEN